MMPCVFMGNVQLIARASHSPVSPPAQLRAQVLRQRCSVLGLGVQLLHEALQPELGALQTQQLGADLPQQLRVSTALLRQQDQALLQDVHQLLHRTEVHEAHNHQEKDASKTDVLLQSEALLKDACIRIWMEKLMTNAH